MKLRFAVRSVAVLAALFFLFDYMIGNSASVDGPKYEAVTSIESASGPEAEDEVTGAEASMTSIERRASGVNELELLKPELSIVEGPRDLRSLDSETRSDASTFSGPQYIGEFLDIDAEDDSSISVGLVNIGEPIDIDEELDSTLPSLDAEVEDPNAEFQESVRPQIIGDPIEFGSDQEVDSKPQIIGEPEEVPDDDPVSAQAA